MRPARHTTARGRPREVLTSLGRNAPVAFCQEHPGQPAIGGGNASFQKGSKSNVGALRRLPRYVAASYRRSFSSSLSAAEPNRSTPRTSASLVRSEGSSGFLGADLVGGLRVSHDARRLLRRQPLELGQELASFPGQRHGQVLGRVNCPQSLATAKSRSRSASSPMSRMRSTLRDNRADSP